MLNDQKVLAFGLLVPTDPLVTPPRWLRMFGFEETITRPPGGWNGGTGVGYACIRAAKVAPIDPSQDVFICQPVGVLPGDISVPDSMIAAWAGFAAFRDAEGDGLLLQMGTKDTAGVQTLADVPLLVQIMRNPSKLGNAFYFP